MIGILAPAGAYRKDDIMKVKEDIEKYMGAVKLSDTCFKRYRGYLAGTDDERVKALEDMFRDDSVDAILCLRGGYGCTRILEKIDYDVIAKNPKPFIGFSDITALNITFMQKCGLKPFHGLLGANAYKWGQFSADALKKALTFDGRLEIENPEGEDIITINGGKCEGILTGGNLSLLTSLLGTEFEPDTDDKIFFIEEVGEPTYKIDRMLMQLWNAGKFKNCRGIIFGDFANCNEAECTIEEVAREFAVRTGVPAVFNVQSGHCLPAVTLPLGEKCILDADNCKITFVK